MELGKISIHLRNPNTLMGRVIYGGTATLAGLALAGCGKDPNKGLTDPATAPQEPQLVFNDLGGGSSVIRVFPSPGAKEENGTYFDGDKVGAICKTEGEERQSDPSVGEVPRHSDEWVQIDGTPGETQFATAVYTEDSEQLLEELPEC